MYAAIFEFQYLTVFHYFKTILNSAPYRGLLVCLKIVLEKLLQRVRRGWEEIEQSVVENEPKK